MNVSLPLLFLLVYSRLPLFSQQAPNLSREQVECNLRFLGLVILQNKIKPATPKVIAELRDAGIRSIMITGDNIYTACSVAHESGLVNSHVRLFFLPLPSLPLLPRTLSSQLSPLVVLLSFGSH